MTTKQNMLDLIKKARNARRSVKKNDSTYSTLGDYINEANASLIKGMKKDAKLNSKQQELYDKLYIAVG